ncbi:3204_t:CDS:2, partial [Funneliformis caledonium]
SIVTATSHIAEEIRKWDTEKLIGEKGIPDGLAFAIVNFINELTSEKKARGNDYPLDAASYLTGLTLIVSGVVSLFRGNKYKWLSIFIAAFYGICMVLLLFILKYQNVTNPSSTLRFVYFVICTGAGAAAGIFFVCLWPTGRILVGALGGFSLAMICLSTRTNGLISNQLIRYIWIGICTVFNATLAGIQRFYQYVAIISTVMSGCYLLMLGTDVFVRGGMLASFKTFWGYNQPEDYLYIVDTNVIIILSTIGFVGGLFGIGAQLLEFWIDQRRDVLIIDDDQMTMTSNDEKSNLIGSFTKRLKNTFKKGI